MVAVPVLDQELPAGTSRGATATMGDEARHRDGIRGPHRSTTVNAPAVTARHDRNLPHDRAGAIAFRRAAWRPR